MATRFYLSSTETVTQTPEFAAWSRTAEALRRSMSPVKDGSAITSTTIWANGTAAADESALARQFVSAPMAAGIAFSTSDTIKAQVRCMESAANDNINRSPITVKVYSEDGTTLRATLLGLGHVGLNTTEWIASTLTNKTIANGDALTANYTTVLGDILVVEMGGQVSAAGGASVLGTMSFGSASATDLGENETDTAANNPWFEISRTISFATVVTTASPTALAVSTFAPSLQFTTVSVPATASLTLSGHVPVLRLTIVPPVASLSLVSFAPSLNTPVTPGASTITASTFAPTVDVTENVTAVPLTASLTISTLAPVIPSIVFLDPGGDAVQGVNYFATGNAGGANLPVFDTSQKVNGVGSYKFDSGAGNNPSFNKVTSVLGASRRISFYPRFDSIPNTNGVDSQFTNSQVVYSGGGFSTPNNLQVDDGTYATATPGRNGAQGSTCSFPMVVPTDAIIDSIKIIYQRKYDTAASIGTSRVRYLVGAEEGPNHDNTDMPTTDTVVTVDITADRTWTHAEVNAIKVIAEALRGDTDTAHTQSWDYVKVEVEYRTAIDLLWGQSATVAALRLQIIPSGSGMTLRIAESATSTYDGITLLTLDTWPRIALSYIQNGLNDLDLKLHVNGVEELWLEGIGTQDLDVGAWPDLIYGWIEAPGANQVMWIDQLYIDDGSDLSDPGAIYMTAKLPAAVNQNNFDTTGGTGAVDERPVNLANYKQQAGSTQQFQNYTLQAADVGDIDVSGETLIGYMGWAVAKRGAGPVSTGAGITVNGVTTNVTLLTTGAHLVKAAAMSASYPSDAAGIGLRSISTGGADTFFYDGGVIQAYRGPIEDILFAEYLLLAEQTAEVVDDLRASPPSSYMLRYWIREGGGTVKITAYSITAEGESPRAWPIIESNGGKGQARIAIPGIEVRIVMEVTEADTYVMLQHYFNV